MARRAGRVMAAFYIPSMRPALLERHGIEPEHVAPVSDHALVSFTDPFTLKAWAGIEVEGLPELEEQVRLVGEQVLAELRAL